MTKRHFEVIAATIKRNIEDAKDIPNENARNAAVWAVQELAEDLARAFREQNQRFDRERFLRACGLE